MKTKQTWIVNTLNFYLLEDIIYIFYWNYQSQLYCKKLLKAGRIPGMSQYIQ